MTGHVSPPPSDSLRALLESNLRFAPEFQQGLLTNHLSMCLVALDRLGAPPARLREFFDAYRGPLEPLRDDAGRRETLLRRLAEVGRETLLRERLPQLVAGLGGAAFHGLIRLAYAIESDLDDELAHALAYFEEAQLPLQTAAAATDEADPLALLESLHALGQPRPQGANIALRMERAFATPEVARTAARLAFEPGTLARLAAAALLVYATSDDFTALHGVTASHAARVVAPYVDETLLARSLWLALAAAYVSTGSPRLPDRQARHALRTRSAPDWSDVAAAALRTNDDHVSKIVFSCRSEDAAYRDPLYRVVAWRAAERGRA